MTFYTSLIIPISVVASVMWVISFYDWNTYIYALSGAGVFMASVFGPLLTQFWKRHCIELVHRWNLSRKHVDDERPSSHDPDYELRPNLDLDGELERVYDPKGGKTKVCVIMPIVMLVNLVVLVVVLFPF